MKLINYIQEIYRPGTAISHASNLCTAVGGDQNFNQSFSPFTSTSVGALGFFTFFPQCTVHNLRISELGVLVVVP